MASDKVRYDLRDGVAVITMDDGKANALSPETIGALHAALDRAENEAGAVLLCGRDKRLSGGFDLGVMTAGAEAARDLVQSGAELMLRLYLFPRPVVVACTGHALAAGAILLLVADVRIGTQGDFKIGLNEVRIQMTLPQFALEFARDRIAKPYFSAAVTQARIFDPESARLAGYLDATAKPEDLFQTAFDQARALAELPNTAFRNTKQRERGATVALIRANLAEDIASLTAPR